MKKLMIAVAAVAMAACAQAGSYSWKIGSSALMTDGKGTKSTVALTGADVYVFCSQNYTQDALLEAFVKNGTFDTSRAIGYQTTDGSGKITGFSTEVGNLGKNASGDPFTVADNATFNTYFATIVGDEVFVSALTSDLTSLANPDVTTWSYSGFATQIRNTTGAYSFNAGGGFQDAGWYTAVPEPTSALLLLLGVAGLALKRRRA